MEKFDAIVVLGSTSTKAGKPDLDGRYRIRKALELYGKGAAKNIVFAGGKTRSSISESVVMKRYALEQDKDLKNIFIETKSKDTTGNAYFTKKLVLEPRGWRKILVVTSSFHVKRAEEIFGIVLGPRYKMKFVGTAYSPRAFFIYVLLGVEKKLLELVRILLRGMRAGDDKEVIRRLLRLHPDYMPKAKFRRLQALPDERIAEMLGTDVGTVKKYRKFLMRRFSNPG